MDVFRVLGIGGIIDALLTGVFVSESLSGTGLEQGITMLAQVGAQLLSVLTTILWSGLLSYIILKVIDKLIGLRVEYEHEVEGLDLSSHDEKAIIYTA